MHVPTMFSLCWRRSNNVCGVQEASSRWAPVSQQLTRFTQVNSTMLIGKEFGPYIVDKELGSGAMGTVFRAKHQKNRSRVAIKLMSLALGSNEAALNRLKHEHAILTQLD